MKQIDTQTSTKLSISAAPANHMKNTAAASALTERVTSLITTVRGFSYSAMSLPCTNLDS